jgi:uncharacterized protein YbgA (DUF1722 family)/uncharacterized protein YbbK (DUF523 family)
MNDAEFPSRPQAPLTVAVSSCLLGNEVRYDGGHKRSSLCHEALDGLFRLRGICPEVGIGMGVPREPIQLVGNVDAPRALGVKDPSRDVTAALADYARQVSPQLEDVSGYILIKNSPSCGLFRVKVYPPQGGAPTAKGRGIYAAALTDLHPQLPMEENGRLEDAVLRENFVMRVFCYAHWRALQRVGLTAARLIAFHSRYKYLLMAHSIQHYRDAGRLLSNLSGNLPAIAEQYFGVLMAGLVKPASRGGHSNVLQHLQGYVSDALDPPARQELAAAIDSYRRGEVPLLAPMTLLRHHLGRHGSDYVLAQTYLEPHPPAAGLRRAL